MSDAWFTEDLWGLNKDKSTSIPVHGPVLVEALVSWLATRTAHTATSRSAQYLALFGFVFAQAIVFVPLLFLANAYAPGTIQSAGIVTMLGFAGWYVLQLFMRSRD